MKINQIVNEDIPVADIAAMATVAGLAYPVMKAMIKAAYKTGKGFLKLKKIANKAGVKLADKVFEDGVIVPGVNTTVDVKPGQTEKEAAKFFGHGKPKELHKKARKNSKPNTLYNLGLAEDKKSDKADDMAGFDPATAMAVKKLQAKYPHAENIMSAMMASTQDTLALQHTMDKKHNRKFQELEKKLLDLIKKNNLKA